ncbi:putative succinylglutamate desuccinylase/aspartoacylase [Methanobrevibacter arboriphilus JCM 13429 = DSM 1125]|uniref:Putative succinylglutamate desuccinylase/aspartoacylase n=1 Tax=Methanobrevibacter arboriphilus JCM 13429 = DSM 1125 TaxID=1300164 RepID=A0A1V6N4I4_METAZ|nr:succinylglutamate desuccinylase/aspartoacylase family protein [Methanobrevibacter arboriphilus]OQD59532.1 putative succinylglutamate desuccinylase/aspartoacylase [Methanobrevibacter arboriphilus JCM 13429 = DSM 1125]
MFNRSKSDDNLKIDRIFNDSGGYIAANSQIFENIPNTSISRKILNESIKGTPIIKFGSSSPKVMIIAGIHGNELPPQIAAVKLIHKLERLEKEDKISGTIYIIPFSSPKSTMDNSRWFNGVDLNRITSVKGSLTNEILSKIKDFNLNSIGDFHSTSINSMPGKEGIFCTMKPSPESFQIAKYISDSTKSELLSYKNAGNAYKGALEDECNIALIPAVTCEVLSPNGTAKKEAWERSLDQMGYYLSYFGIISKDSI